MISHFTKQLFSSIASRFSKSNGNGTRQVFEIKDDHTCTTDPDMPFESLNPFQSCFKENYNNDRNCVAIGSTGTGKTVLAYIASRCFLDEGQKIILTGPTRELVKSLYREAVGIWGAKIVGINTGNDKNVADKFFIVTTPEGYLSAVRSGKEWTKAKLLIVDEAHNMMEASRGGDLDVAITCHAKNGGRLLLMSATFPEGKDVAQWLDADLFISLYKKTNLHVHEIHAPDDLETEHAPKKPSLERVITLLGYSYKRDSIRLKLLKDVLKSHEGKSILIFVPTKITGFCLSESLVVPFHCADIDEKEKTRIVAEFRGGFLKTLLATNTLSQGINTPADVVVVFGTRRGSFYLNNSEVQQMFGRAGRGKSDANVYIIGDKIELFNAKKTGYAKTLPIPVESMILTLLSINPSTQKEISTTLGETFAATMTTKAKIDSAVGKYLRYIGACNILSNKMGEYSLTKEGLLLARYFISPSAYLNYISIARKLMNNDMPEIDKGCVLLSLILPLGQAQECPPRIHKDMLMKLIPLELGNGIRADRAGLLKHFIARPRAIPPYLQYQLRDADRWISMFTDFEKYGVHKETPGKAWLQEANSALKTSAAKNLGRKKSEQLPLLKQTTGLTGN